MGQATAVSDFAALEQKLDAVASQVQYLTEEAKRASRRQQERAELVQDVIPIANDAFGILTEQLEEVQEYVDLCDLLRLVKRLLRNGRNLDKMLDQLESLMDLTQTVGPLTDNVLEKATDLFQKAEQKGYFDFARTGAHVFDDLVTTIGQEDGRQPEDVSLRALLKQMRDPDTRRGLAVGLRALQVIGRNIGKEQEEGQ
jgi:uncharacterized protein YjgD (DUF1641 family)